MRGVLWAVDERTSETGSTRTRYQLQACKRTQGMMKYHCAILLCSDVAKITGIMYWCDAICSSPRVNGKMMSYEYIPPMSLLQYDCRFGSFSWS